MRPFRGHTIRSPATRLESQRSSFSQTCDLCGGCGHEWHGRSILSRFRSRPAAIPWSHWERRFRPIPERALARRFFENVFEIHLAANFFLQVQLLLRELVFE